MSTSPHSAKSRVAAISILASASMAVAKFVVGIAIGSLALISEALHSSVDLVATVVTWLVVRVSDRPADEEHHYGHGKIESLSALGVIAMLYVLAGGILVAAWARLREGTPPPAISIIPFAVLLLDIAVNLWRGGGAAPRRARHREPGAGGRCAAFCLRRDRLGRRDHRAGAIRARLPLGRRGGGDRRCGRDLAARPAAGALHRGNPARPRPRRRLGKGRERDPEGAGRGWGRAPAGPHGGTYPF